MISFRLALTNVTARLFQHDQQFAFSIKNKIVFMFFACFILNRECNTLVLLSRWSLEREIKILVILDVNRVDSNKYCFLFKEHI